MTWQIISPFKYPILALLNHTERLRMINFVLYCFAIFDLSKSSCFSSFVSLSLFVCTIHTIWICCTFQGSSKNLTLRFTLICFTLEKELPKDSTAQYGYIVREIVSISNSFPSSKVNKMLIYIRKIHMKQI